jgi:hypothetical protein
MSPRHRHNRSYTKGLVRTIFADNVFTRIWEGFWSPPDAACPKCGNTNIEWYDPFFFSFWRTLNGRRRYRCSQCRFVWRKSRSGQSFLGRMGGDN